MQTDTARERATDLLHEALSQPFGTEVPRSVAASIVNEILAACGEETWSANHAKATEEAIEKIEKILDQLTRAVLALAAMQGVFPPAGVDDRLAFAANELEVIERSDAERLKRGDRRDG